MNRPKFVRPWPFRSRPAVRVVRGATLHREPESPPPTAGEPGISRWITALYGAAALLTVVGAVRVVADGTAVTLAYLAPLIGIFVAVAAGVQQLDKQRVERRQARAQDERDSLRRFDDRFAAATKATVKHDREQRAGAAVELMSFLREENRGFHQQTYYYVLSYLKVSAAEPLIDQAFSRVFQRAAHLVLPELSAHEHRLAVDFSHARLSGVDLSGLELGEADLSRTVLRRANLAGCCLWRAHGMRTDLGGASLRHANLEEVVLLDGLDAVGADFSFANLVAARFAPRGAPGNAVLRGAHFVAARLQGACLNGADLRDGRFEGANLRGASLRGVLLNDAAVGSILRALNHTWRAAAWDPSVWRYLKAEARGAKLAPPPKRKPSDVPDPHYRRHPYPGHPDHVSRPRLVG